MEGHAPVDALAEAGGHRGGLLLTADHLLGELVQVIEFFPAKRLAYVLRQRLGKGLRRPPSIHEDERLASRREDVRHQAGHVVFSHLDFLNTLVREVDETVEIDSLLEGNGPPFARDVLGFEPSREFLGILDGRTEGQDRKSTRLNSSHVSISYAVFCLKKKS